MNNIFKKIKTSLLNKKIFYFLTILILILLSLNSCSKNSKEDNPFKIVENNLERSIIELNLRIHIMSDIIMIHPSGLNMPSWISNEDVSEIILPEINSIWEQADIKWKIESVVKEDVVKSELYEESIAFISSTKRDSQGRSNPERLPHLFSLMQPSYMSNDNELEKNLFHIYIFPFIGNTSQGNAMRDFNFHSVVGTWTNKHNGGGIPEKTLLKESQNLFIRGSLSRTISHEIGHVLGLNHNECNSKCLMGGGSNGYSLTKAQINTARLSALDRF